MKIAIPNKGRLKDPVLQFLSSVGVKGNFSDDRALIIPTNWEGVQLVMVRTEDIPNIVESGASELGITGHDYVVESNAEVEELIRLDFGKSKIVFAIPISWNVDRIEEISREIRIATKYYNIAKEYIEKKNIRAKIVKISGAAEVMPSLGAADAIIDVMSTGTTLKLHGLKPVDTILESRATVIANRDWIKSDEADKINMLLTLMKGALMARNRKMIFMNVPDSKLDNVLSSLPAMLSPTLSKLARSDAWEVITVVEEDLLPEVIAKVKSSGAMDIVVVDIEKVIK